MRRGIMAFETLKNRLLYIPLEEKRALYKVQNFVTLNDIPKFEQWGESLKKDYPNTHNRVYLWRGDITRLEIDAIVNAANTELLAGGGVCGSIFRAAGKLPLSDECDSIEEGCPTGSSVITGGYYLPAKYVIHAVGPMDEIPEVLQSTYESILKVCSENNIASVAIPCISTGIYGYPGDKAAKIAVDTILKKLPDSVTNCILCTFLEEDFNIYNNLLQGK